MLCVLLGFCVFVYSFEHSNFGSLLSDSNALLLFCCTIISLINVLFVYLFVCLSHLNHVISLFPQTVSILLLLFLSCCFCFSIISL